MKKFLMIVAFLLIPNVINSQTLIGTFGPDKKTHGVPGDINGTPYYLDAMPPQAIVDYQVLFAAQAVAAGVTITGTYASSSLNLQKWIRVAVTGSGTNTWRYKFKGSPDGIVYNYIADKPTITGGLIPVTVNTDTLKYVSAVVSPGFWYPLTLTDGTLISFPFLQIEFTNAAGASSSATATIEICARRF